MVQSVLLVDAVFGVAVDCGVAVNASGVIVGLTSALDGVLPPQAERITSSKLIPAHITYLPGRFLHNLHNYFLLPFVSAPFVVFYWGKTPSRSLSNAIFAFRRLSLLYSNAMAITHLMYDDSHAYQ